MVVDDEWCLEEEEEEEEKFGAVFCFLVLVGLEEPRERIELVVLKSAGKEGGREGWRERREGEREGRH